MEWDVCLCGFVGWVAAFVGFTSLHYWRGLRVQVDVDFENRFR